MDALGQAGLIEINKTHERFTHQLGELNSISGLCHVPAGCIRWRPICLLMWSGISLFIRSGDAPANYIP
jgi:hypothetical protein